MSKYRKALFWDTDFEKIDWQNNFAWIIRRVFEYGNEKEVLETISFYGKKTVVDTLSAVKDSWNKESRENNLRKYLDYEIEN